MYVFLTDVHMSFNSDRAWGVILKALSGMFFSKQGKNPVLCNQMH